MIYSFFLSICLLVFSTVSFAAGTIGQIKVEIVQTNHVHNTPVTIRMNGSDIGSFAHSTKSKTMSISEAHLSAGSQTPLKSNYGSLQSGCEFQYVLYFSLDGNQWIRLGKFNAPTEHVNTTIPLGLCKGKICSSDLSISEQIKRQEEARWEKNKEVLRKWLEDSFEKERIAFEESKRRALEKAQLSELRVDVNIELPDVQFESEQLNQDKVAQGAADLDSVVDEVILEAEREETDRTLDFLKACQATSSYQQYLCSTYGGLGWMGAIAESYTYGNLAEKGLLTQEQIRQKIISKESQGRYKLAGQIERQTIVKSEIEKRKQAARLVRHLKDIRELAVNGARFAPGVSDGIDIYEALYGMDASTGLNLDGSQRLFAILGIIAGNRFLWDGLTSEAKLLILGDKSAFQSIEGIKEIERFGPMKPGALHAIDLGNGSVADTFRSSSYYEVISDSPITLYRTYESDRSELGRYWSRMAPSGPLQTTLDLAIDPAWGSNATKWVEVKIPAGTKIYEGIASEIPLRRGTSKVQVGQLLGGGQQVYIEGRIDHSWVQKRGAFK